MKLFHQFLIFTILGLLQLALAAQSQKPVIITYPDDTPDSVLNNAKKAIIDAGGSILSEFALIKGFVAEASSSALKTVQAASTNFLPVIEDDGPVTIYKDEQ